MSAHASLNDEAVLATAHDLLSREALIETLLGHITGSKAPIVFGVHGEWGAGKTSFLGMLAASVTAHPGHHQSIWFDAWRYQNEAAPIVALLHEMRSALSLTEKAKAAITKAGHAALATVFSQFDLIIKAVTASAVPFSFKKMASSLEAQDRATLSEPLPSKAINKALNEVVTALLPNEHSRLVIFIDDLDRCEPAAVFHLLQGLKIYLNLDNCVFILGINQPLVVEALARHYGAKTESEIGPYTAKAAAYLEKICGNVWALPPPTEPESLLRLHWLTHALTLDGNHLSMALEAALPGHCRCLPPNPRKLKMLANTLVRCWPRLQAAAEWADAAQRIELTRAFVIVAYTFQFHHSYFLRWRQNPSAGLTMLLDWLETRSPKTKKTFEESYGFHYPITQPGETADNPVHLPDPSQPGYFWAGPLLLLMKQLPAAAAPTNSPNAGMTPEQALAAAQGSLGTVTQTAIVRPEAFSLMLLHHVY